MKILRESFISTEETCVYIPDKQWRFKYLFLEDLDSEELNNLLAQGWRKFGIYYFLPVCTDCSSCIPVRVLTRDFQPSKSQRRILRKSEKVRVEFHPLSYSHDIYQIYKDHSMNRFEKTSNEIDFISTFYTPSCPCLQSEYYLDDELVAVGFLDVSNEALSSVYFIYKTSVQHLGLGHYSVLREIEYAAQEGLKYYYLGYYVGECSRMQYKNTYHPNEKYDWARKIWEREDGKGQA